MNRILVARPLTRESFETFGDVIDTDGAGHFPINAGRCQRYHDLARVEVDGPGARVLVNIFRGEPAEFPLRLPMVERHPFGSQAFVPLEGRPFLVVVCPDDDGKPGNPEVFITAGRQGVNYRINVWHAPLLPLGRAQDFLVVDRGGSGVNLEEHHFAEPYVIEHAAGDAHG